MKISFLSYLLVIVSIALPYQDVFGQEEDYDDYEEEYEEEITRVHFLETNYSMFFPLDAFSDKIEKDLMHGVSIAYLFQLQKEKPSFLGFDVSYKGLGSYAKDYDAFVGNEQLLLSGKVVSSAIGLSTIYRYYMPLQFWRIEPYVEGQFGGKWLFTYLSESGSFIDNEVYENTDILESDFVLTYGGAFGFQMHISEIYYLNIKALYHFAVSGEYQNRLTENLENIDFPQEAFETVQSTTNVVRLDLGFTFLF